MAVPSKDSARAAPKYPERSEPVVRSERVERPERVERLERVERPESMERPERVELAPSGRKEEKKPSKEKAGPVLSKKGANLGPPQGPLRIRYSLPEFLDFVVSGKTTLVLNAKLRFVWAI